MANLFGNVPAPKFPDPWQISAEGNREMMQGFTSAFNTAQRIAAEERMKREDPLTALKRDQAVNNLALTALEIKAAQMKNQKDVEAINDRAVGMREFEQWRTKAGKDATGTISIPFEGTSEYGMKLASQYQALAAKDAEDKLMLKEQADATRRLNQLSAEGYVPTSKISLVRSLRGDRGEWNHQALTALDEISTEAGAAKLKAKQDQFEARQQLPLEKLITLRDEYATAGRTEDAALVSQSIKSKYQNEASKTSVVKNAEAELEAFKTGNTELGNILRDVRTAQERQIEQRMQASLERIKAQGENTAKNTQISAQWAVYKKAIADLNNPRTAADLTPEMKTNLIRTAKVAHDNALSLLDKQETPAAPTVGTTDANTGSGDVAGEAGQLMTTPGGYRYKISK